MVNISNFTSTGPGCKLFAGSSCCVLSPGQTIATFWRNISQHCWEQHVACIWPPCCDVLQHVGCCWLKFENGQIFHAPFADVAWCCSRLASTMQQCCAQACALVRFSIPNMSQHVATGWPNARNELRPTMLGYVVFKCWPVLANAGPTMLGYVGLRCCEHLAGAL